MKKILLLSAMFMAFVSLSNAQIKTPPASPLCKINQEVGLIKVDVEYSRPSAKGRRIFGELVPFGQMWRTGANASTKITLSDDAMKTALEADAVLAVPHKSATAVAD